MNTFFIRLRPIGVLFDVYVFSAFSDQNGLLSDEYLPWEITVHTSDPPHPYITPHSDEEVLFWYRSSLKEVIHFFLYVLQF